MLFLKIVIGIAALALGIYLGLPGRYDRSPLDVERSLDGSGHRRKWTKRHFTPMDLLRRDKRGSERRRVRRYFNTALPKAKDDPEPEQGPPQVKLGR